jgi:hypothetical protein
MERAAGMDALVRLRESQRVATADLIARLADGRMSLTEVVDALEDNSKGQPAFLTQLALDRDETTVRGRLAGYALDRARERLGDDHEKVITLLGQLRDLDDGTEFVTSSGGGHGKPPLPRKPTQ